jgi:NADH-quinone oxidoreductase subunit L
MSISTLIWLIPLPPILAFFLIVLFTNRDKGLSHSLAIGSVFLSWVASMVIFFQAIQVKDLGHNPFSSSLNWLPIGDSWFKIGVQIDPLQAVTLFFASWTILTIFIYSIGYHNYGQPKGEIDKPGLPPRGATITDEEHQAHRIPSIDPLYSRFFAFLSLFAFGMFLLVVSDNFLTLYIGWEIMGLCSYLLIGFWYGRESARNAAVKAFVTTRIGDVFLLLGIIYLYSATGTLNIYEIFGSSHVLVMLAQTNSGVFGLSVAGLIGLFMVIGTIGKSAQWPLHVWLPDAMEGPTPVSAMIHAATMVSAGIYLAIRIFPLVSAGWSVGNPLNPTMLVMTIIGAFTTLFAASIAVAQNDIKRVLAYSTISQLGYMLAALGIGAYAAAAFHLVMHAFFKALLFLGSGSVIHGMEHGVFHSGEDTDTQNMFNMGGLRRKMPQTFWTFLVGGLALSGFPLVTAGFWSKDAILSNAFDRGYWLVFVVLALAALLTAFYIMRQITLTFLGEPRTEAARFAKEPSRLMTIPLVVLAVFSVGAGWVGIPKKFPLLGSLIPDWFENFINGAFPGNVPVILNSSSIPLAISLVVALGGLYIGWLVYRHLPKDGTDPLQNTLGVFYRLLKNKFYFDELYHVIFVVPVLWVAKTFTSTWVDRGLIDGILDGIAQIVLWLGTIAKRLFDLPVINGTGDAIGKGIRLFGYSLKPVQSGRVQQYMITIFVVAIIAFIFLFIRDAKVLVLR